MKGEGLVGLTRGFIYAGAKGVVVRLGRVQDMGTSELMKRFYHHKSGCCNEGCTIRNDEKVFGRMEFAACQTKPTEVGNKFISPRRRTSFV